MRDHELWDRISTHNFMIPRRWFYGPVAVLAAVSLLYGSVEWGALQYSATAVLGLASGGFAFSGPRIEVWLGADVGIGGDGGGCGGGCGGYG
ncbi:MAG: hypothetical protein WCE69_12510, partial [Aestuariivirga sp.]